MSDIDHDPFPSEEGTDYEYTGSMLRLPVTGRDEQEYVQPGETVRLPDRIADHIDDSLEELVDDEPAAGAVTGEAAPDPDDVDEDAEPDGAEEADPVQPEAAEGLAVPENVDDGELPEEFPAALPDEYPTLQKLATANGVDAQQSKGDLVEDLEQLRDAGGE